MASSPDHAVSRRGGGQEESPNDETVVIPVQTVPGASRSEIVGMEAGTLKVRVAAPPVRGKANKELVELLAKALGVRRTQVQIVGGLRARRKTVRVHGVHKDEVSSLLSTGKASK